MTESKGRYVNEENHQNIKNKLRKVGIVLLVVGGCLALTGIVLLIIGFANLVDMLMVVFSVGGFSLVIGFALLGFGLQAFFVAHAREIASYGASSVAPVVGDTMNYVTDKVSPSVNDAVGEMAETITSGIKKGKSSSRKIKCSKCGAENNARNKFCANCGEKLAKDKNCSNCNAKIEEGTKFCPNCGTKVDEN